MAVAERDLFTVGVFKDLAWAERGVAALTEQGIPAAAFSVLAKETPETSAFVEKVTGTVPGRVELPTIGAAVAHGALIVALQGAVNDLARIGLAAAMRRAGFQPHDGLIYETLTGRGGILVAVHGAPRAADALATMLSYGGANAAIGAWGGRV